MALLLECLAYALLAGAEPSHYRVNLPLAPTFADSVIQGNHETRSHVDQDAFAWDFAAPEGEPVLAAAPGIVVETAEDLIVTDLGRGRFAVYQHLATQDVRVSLGECVQAGQVLARVGKALPGNTAHLHFEVVDFLNQSVPVRFSEPSFSPKACRELVVSTLPRDVFAREGVRLDPIALTRVWPASQNIALRGEVVRKADYVVAVLRTRATGEIVQKVAARVTPDKRFALALATSGLSGAYDFVVMTADDAGRFSAQSSVPVVITPESAVLALGRP